MPGDFMDKLVKQTKNKSIPNPAAREYSMADITFRAASTPAQVLSVVMNQHIQALESGGNFEMARKLREQPQPWMNAPEAMAVFMAASDELKKRDVLIDDLIARIERLEEKLGDQPAEAE